jgi:addiction module HigA family antidote
LNFEAGRAENARPAFCYGRSTSCHSEASAERAAEELHVPANRIRQIVDGQRSITGETALRLARYYGTSAEFWLGMQKDYDLQVARDEFEAEVTRQVRPRNKAA